MKKKSLIEEARHYVDNAHDTLNRNEYYDPETRSYDDEKYVRSAGHYLWHAVMLALDAVFYVRQDRRTRVDIDAYREAVGKRDRKLLATCDEGFLLANDIIDRCERLCACRQNKH